MYTHALNREINWTDQLIIRNRTLQSPQQTRVVNFCIEGAFLGVGKEAIFFHIDFFAPHYISCPRLD